MIRMHKEHRYARNSNPFFTQVGEPSNPLVLRLPRALLFHTAIGHADLRCVRVSVSFTGERQRERRPTTTHSDGGGLEIRLRDMCTCPPSERKHARTTCVRRAGAFLRESGEADSRGSGIPGLGKHSRAASSRTPSISAK